MRQRRISSAILVLVAICMSVVLHGTARGTHNQWSHCEGFPNVYADQETANLYNGIAGRMFTHQPVVVTDSYTASHIYAFRDGSATFAELGWVRGQRDVNNVTLQASTWYSAMEEPGVPYQERYFGSAPAGYMNYKAENVGWNNVSLKWKWGAFFSAGTFSSTPNWTWEIASMNWGQMLSGGEVSLHRGAQMQTTMQPSHQLRLPSTGAWHDWTDALMSLNNDTTSVCNDSRMTISYTVRFDTYTTNGTVQ